ncbi:MAG TPA: hypothetical protein VG147_04250 [Solirubrobacteraceae bacterium]|jgi:hypothetical protein|nr:hypothetical protein [Solirubrobacteraceae bacterium]
MPMFQFQLQRRSVLVCLTLSVVVCAAIGSRSAQAAPTRLVGVACPSASQCTAVNAAGQEVTFNPASPGTPTPITIDSLLTTTYDSLTSIACPSVGQCAAIDAAGQEVTFNPASPGTLTPTTIDHHGAIEPGVSPVNFLVSVACPSSTQCTAVGYNGHEVTFNPASPSTASTMTVGSYQYSYKSVACPSITQCTAIDSYTRRAVTFNPTSPGTVTTIFIDRLSYLGSIACVSITQCTATDLSGYEVTFNPTSHGKPHPIKIDHGCRLSVSCELWSVACPSVGQCTAVDNGGREITFNPTSPGNRTTARIERHSLASVACPLTTRCVAVGASDRPVTFDPANPQRSPARSKTLTPMVTISQGCVLRHSTSRR